MKKTLVSISENFEQTITDLKNACRAKTAVPVDQVYVIRIL